MYDYDIAIVGGGAIGASLACALSHSNLKIALIEAVVEKEEYQPSYDDRGLALSLSSKKILEDIGVWESMLPFANPIRHIHVSDQHHFGFVRMHAASMGIEAFGYVVLAHKLGKAFMQHIQTAKNINLLRPALVTDIALSDPTATIHIQLAKRKQIIRSKLLIAADGTTSKIRDMLNIQTVVKDYQQAVIVSNITPEKPHADTAYQRFTSTGPVALLPHSKQRCILVFSTAADEAEKYLKMDDEDFLNILLKRFSRRLGRFSKLGKRKSYCIKMVRTTQQLKNRAVLIGNAAHTVHPHGAQGLNLGLRDVAALAKVLLEAHHKDHDIGTLQILNPYAEKRVYDQNKVIDFTNKLAYYFYSKNSGKIILRNLAMLAIDLIPPLKDNFIHKAMGFSSMPSIPRFNFSAQEKTRDTHDPLK